MPPNTSYSSKLASRLTTSVLSWAGWRWMAASKAIPSRAVNTSSRSRSQSCSSGLPGSCKSPALSMGVSPHFHLYAAPGGLGRQRFLHRLAIRPGQQTVVCQLAPVLLDQRLSVAVEVQVPA